MLTQNHEYLIKEFSGQTSAFNAAVVKPDAFVLGQNKQANNVRYVYGELGRGHWTFIAAMILKEIPEEEECALILTSTCIHQDIG